MYILEVKNQFYGIVISSSGEVTFRYLKNGVETQSKVTGLSGKVVDVQAGLNATGSTAYAFFLMEDGTVEKSSDLYNMKNTGEVKSIGKVEGLNSIVRLCYVDNNKNGVSVAIDKDGYAYEIK